MGLQTRKMVDRNAATKLIRLHEELKRERAETLTSRSVSGGKTGIQRNPPRRMLLAVCLLTVCGCSSENGSNKQGLRGTCQTGADCASGVCINFTSGDNGYCSAACGSQCPEGMVCGTAPDGSNACMEACVTPNHGNTNYWGCRNSVPVACAVADESYCHDCGCPNTLRCEPGVGCQSKRDVNGPCSLDSDCKSNNCSTYLGVCRVPVQSACSTANCDLCMREPNDNSTFCSRECDDNLQCNGGVCLGGNGYYTCSRPCSACGGNIAYCKVTSNTLELYCACPECIAESAPRPLNIACGPDSDCESNSCYSAGGFCTTTCTTDSDCASAGMVCVTMPCSASGQSNDCGSMCQRPCSSDGTCSAFGVTCRTLPTPTNTSTAICDSRRENGVGCGFNEQCLSGRCTSQICVTVTGAPNGTACTNSSDCASASCVNRYCRGTAMIGDTCQVSADCSVGSCCSNTTTCATTC